MDESYLHFSELNEKLREYLEKCFPYVEWKKTMKGAAIPSKVTGTVSASSISFSDGVKGSDMAEVSYSIYLIDPASSAGVVEMAMMIRKALIENDTLNGAFQSSMVNKIDFGAAPGLPESAGASLISFKAKIWIGG